MVSIAEVKLGEPEMGLEGLQPEKEVIFKLVEGSETEIKFGLVVARGFGMTTQDQIANPTIPPAHTPTATKGAQWGSCS